MKARAGAGHYVLAGGVAIQRTAVSAQSPTPSGQPLSQCIRSALQQFFPKVNVWGKNYSPVDDERFKSGIPGWVDELANLPFAVKPDAVTLGVFDIHYNPGGINISGGNRHSLETVIEETAHAEQFLNMWAKLPQQFAPLPVSPYVVRIHPPYSKAQDVWKGLYVVASVSAVGYDNLIEKEAKAKVQFVMNRLISSAAPNQAQVCGFNLYK